MNQIQPRNLTKREFLKVLKENGFADKNTIVTRISYGEYDYTSGLNGEIVEFEVETSHGMNVGNLVSIERQYGLGLSYVKPLNNGTMFVKFNRVLPRK